ncbi:formate/nitrite transporter family protein [Olsenella uli]|uniref:formate/nitrite transporter family protein n=1 Tax=Olsenella uli TaxID=133926 RepID=UPI0012AC3918|nr:formate/nitrite transporter family protein [Olsenella uli]
MADSESTEPKIHPLFPGRAFISTVLDALESKETMSSAMTGVYLQRSAMAGFFVGLFFTTYFAVFSACAALGATGALAGRILAPLVFGWALVFIYYTNSELLTANMMVISIGCYHRRIVLSHAVRLLLYCLVGNLIGALIFAVLIRFSSVLDAGMLEQMTAAVARKAGYVATLPGAVDLFIRAMFCNFCINIAMLLVYNGKLHNDFTKCTIMIVAVFVFAFLGFEHSIANSALFMIMGLRGGVDAGAAVLSVLVTILGNLVGGGVLIGLNFAIMNRDSCRVRH